MTDRAPAGWLLPVLLAVSTSAAVAFGFLYLTRPNPGDLGTVRVVVTDDTGKPGTSVQVAVFDAPYPQTDTVRPGSAFTGVVRYPAPYRLPPHVKLTSPGKRRYAVAAETELGFTWVAQPLPDDFREDVMKAETPAKAEALLQNWLGASLEFAAAQGRLKPGLVFDDFTWEAKGLRAPPASLPPKPFEQAGTFYSVIDAESPVNFPVPYESPPQVTIAGSPQRNTILTEVTAKGFKWRNTAKDRNGWDGEMTWKALGVVGARGDGK